MLELFYEKNRVLKVDSVNFISQFWIHVRKLRFSSNVHQTSINILF